MILIALFLCGLTILADLYLIINWASATKLETPSVLVFELPFVSVLLAVRNEELTLERCLQSLLTLNYPIEKLEILIGNDDSSDATQAIIDRYVTQHSSIKTVPIHQGVNHQKAKANVLMQLAQEAKGQYFAITDADIAVPKNWLQTLLGQFSEQTGIVMGYTGITTNRLFHRFQDIDWAFALGLIKVVSERWQGQICMGNNMMISREAYQKIGGYESIPFSLTEDYELFKHVKASGYQSKNIVYEDAMAVSLPQTSFADLLKQRRRWMVGALQLAKPLWIFLFLQAIYFPSLLLVLFLSWPLGFVVFLTKAIIQAYFIRQVHAHLKYSHASWSYLFYEFYSLTLTCLLLPYTVFSKVEWRGRRYA